MRDLLIDKNKQELKQHGNVEFPFRIGYEDIWQYDMKIFGNIIMENLLVIGIKK